MTLWNFNLGPMPLPASCFHSRLIPTAAAYVLQDPDLPNNPQAILYAVHVSVICPDCQVRFRFLGDNALAPSTAKEAQRDKRGAWVSGTADELGCLIAPIEPGEPLEGIEVQGRA